MKNKKKPTIKKKYIPKYNDGGESSSMMDDNQSFFTNNQNHNAGYNPADPNRQEQTSSGMSTNQGIAMGASAVGSIGSAINANNPTPQPNDQFNTSFDKTFNSTSNGVSAVSPLWGGVTKAIGQIAQPIKKELNQTETGRKVNYGAGWVFAPLETGLASQKTGVWSPNEYNQQYVDQQNMNKQNSQQFAMGGVMKYPNGGTEFTQFNEPSHEQQNPNVPNIPGGQVELDENMVGNKIFTARFGPNGKKGPTFADLNKKNNTNKEDKILEDDKASSLAKSTAKSLKEFKLINSERIFQSQEQLKQEKVANYAKRMGLPAYNPQTNSQQEFRNGGIKQYAGGGTAQEIYDRDRQRIINENTPMSTLQPIQGTLDESIDYNQTPSNYDPAYDTSSMRNEYAQTNPEFWNGSNKPASEKRDIPYGAIGSAIGNNVGNLMYLKDQGKRYDKVNYGSISPKLIDFKEALRQGNMESAAARNNLKNVVGGNGGAYMANIGQIQNNNTLNKAGIIERGNNANAQISNNMAQFNKQNEIQGMRDEAGNKGAALTNYYKAIEGIGTNTTAAYTDYKKGKMDTNTAKMLSDSFANYGLDMNKQGDWTIYYKMLNDKQGLGATSNLPSTPKIPK